MAITPELAQAYLATLFVVQTDRGELTFPGQGESAPAGRLLTQHGVRTAAFLTAYNPLSQTLETTINEEMQRQLIQDLDGKWNYFPGEGRDPKGQWQAEPSLLILGISQEEARNLAAIYRQNAFVFVESSGMTRMIATNPAEQAVIDAYVGPR